MKCEGGFPPVPEKKRTNADRIRQMSDEELAAWIVNKTIGAGTEEAEWYYGAWLDWLKEEAKR